MTNDKEPPPLPAPTKFFGHSTAWPMYSTEELIAYARQAVAEALAAREVAVPVALSDARPARPSDDKLWDQTLRERDGYRKWADRLAEVIAGHTGVDIGEHSNMNNPWMQALDALAEFGAATGQPQAEKFGGSRMSPAAAPPVRRSDCTAVLRAAGKPYPRTCDVCGLGPCRYPAMGQQGYRA